MYANDPIGWIHKFINFDGLKLDRLTWQQEEIATALVEHKNIAVSAGGGIGKTALMAMLIQWFLVTHPFSKIPTTAPTAKQLHDILWSEISLWLKRNRLRDMYETRKGRLFIKGFPEWYAVARTVSKDTHELNDTLAGFHARHLLITVDEACFDEETEILTDFGWQTIDTIKDYHEVLTLNPITEEAEYRPITKIFKYEDYDGPMYYYKSRTVSFMFSPNHNVLFRRRNTRGRHKTNIRMQKMREFDITKQTPWYMPKKVNFKGKNEEIYVLKEFSTPRKYYPPKYVSMVDWCTLLGWYISEGYLTKDGYVNITQADPNGRASICALLDRLEYRYHIYGNDIHIVCRQLHNELLACGKGAKNKRIPHYVKNLDKRYLFFLLAAMIKGDGYSQNDNRHIIYTMSKQLADDIQEIAIKCGLYSTITRRHIKGRTTFIQDHYATTSDDDYVVSIVSNSADDFKVRQHNIKKIHYKGRIWCVATEPYHTIYVRRKGVAYWTGNSGVPDPVFTALTGAMTDKNSYIVLISNPVSTGGFYYDTITDPEGKGKNFKVLFFSAKDSPLVDPTFEEFIITRYGKDSPMYKAKVLGLPIGEYDSVVVPPDLFDEVVNTNKGFDTGSYILSVDVGGSGPDATVFCYRCGKSFYKWETFDKTDPTYVSDLITSRWYTDFQGKPFTCVVDAHGIGAGVYSNLTKANKFPVIGFIGPQKAFHEEMFQDKRAEGFYRLHKNFKDFHFPVPPPQRLKKELANLKFDYSSGPIKMEDKKSFKKRLGFSPDYADAMMMSCVVEDFAAISASRKVSKRAVSILSSLRNRTRETKYGKFSKFVQ